MTSPAEPQNGYHVAPHDLTTQVTTLTGIGERTTSLASSAGQLGERAPMLGTAPPALHLAMRLREAMGRSGLTGELDAADTELNNYHGALQAAVTSYETADADVEQKLRTTGGSAT